MDAEFWHERWRENQIGFHEAHINDFLVRHWPDLGVPEGGRVFVPLCGRTLAIGWLLGQGYRVAGAELSAMAVDRLFVDLGVIPEKSPEGALVRYQVPGLDVFVGDIFALSRETLGPVDATYDRAALVALPREMRRRYVHHLLHITSAAPQLLISFDYDQAAMEGPPFSVPEEEVRELYTAVCSVTRIDAQAVPGGLKGLCPATEEAWILRCGGKNVAQK